MDPALRKRLTLAGAVLLSIWALPTVVLGLIFSAGLIFFDMNPPILCFKLQNLSLKTGAESALFVWKLVHMERSITLTGSAE